MSVEYMPLRWIILRGADLATVGSYLAADALFVYTAGRLRLQGVFTTKPSDPETAVEAHRPS